MSVHISFCHNSGYHLSKIIFSCVLICFFILLPSWSVLPQISHLYGCSPVWILVCTLRCTFCRNPLLQMSHLNGRSGMCDFLCLARFTKVEKCLSQSSQVCGAYWRSGNICWGTATDDIVPYCNIIDGYCSAEKCPERDRKYCKPEVILSSCFHCFFQHYAFVRKITIQNPILVVWNS